MKRTALPVLGIATLAALTFGLKVEMSAKPVFDDPAPKAIAEKKKKGAAEDPPPGCFPFDCAPPVGSGGGN